MAEYRLTNDQVKGIEWAIRHGLNALDDGFAFPRDQNREILHAALEALGRGGSGTVPEQAGGITANEDGSLTFTPPFEYSEKPLSPETVEQTFGKPHAAQDKPEQARPDLDPEPPPEDPIAAEIIGELRSRLAIAEAERDELRLALGDLLKVSGDSPRRTAAVSRARNLLRGDTQEDG